MPLFSHAFQQFQSKNPDAVTLSGMSSLSQPHICQMPANAELAKHFARNPVSVTSPQVKVPDDTTPNLMGGLPFVDKTSESFFLLLNAREFSDARHRIRCVRAEVIIT